MKVYRKKLHSLEELLREKHVLKYALSQSNKDKDIPAFGARRKPKIDVREESSDILSIAGDIFTSKGAVNTALAVALPLLKTFGRKAEKGVVKTLAVEILGGYIKWKAVHFGFRILKRAVSKKNK